MKQKTVWNGLDQEKTFMKYLCLNVINKYNMRMNAVDIADQLRHVYCPDHWMRNRMWWWAIFIWGIGVAGINAYKIYKVMYEDAKRANNEIMPPKWTHQRFLEELVNDFVFPGTASKHVGLLKDMDNETFCSSVCSTHNFFLYGQNQPTIDYDLTCLSGIKSYLDEVRPYKLFPRRMDDDKFFKH